MCQGYNGIYRVFDAFLEATSHYRGLVIEGSRNLVYREKWFALSLFTSVFCGASEFS